MGTMEVCTREVLASCPLDLVRFSIAGTKDGVEETRSMWTLGQDYRGGVNSMLMSFPR